MIMFWGVNWHELHPQGINRELDHKLDVGVPMPMQLGIHLIWLCPTPRIMSVARLCACTVMGRTVLVPDSCWFRFRPSVQLEVPNFATHIKSSRHAVPFSLLPRAHVVRLKSSSRLLQQMVWCWQLMQCSWLRIWDHNRLRTNLLAAHGGSKLSGLTLTFLRWVVRCCPTSEARAGVGFGISGIFLSVDIACELLPKEPWAAISNHLISLAFH